MKRLLVAGDWILVETKNEELVLRNSSMNYPKHNIWSL